jgi:hypothetical protein
MLWQSYSALLWECAPPAFGLRQLWYNRCWRHLLCQIDYPWFHRIWVEQEVALERDADLCGIQWISWEVLESMAAFCLPENDGLVIHLLPHLTLRSDVLLGLKSYD